MKLTIISPHCCYAYTIW